VSLPKSARYLLTTSILVAVLAAPALLHVAKAEAPDPYSKLYELYTRTVRLASQGIDVGGVVEHLSRALKLLELGRYTEALEELGRAEGLLSELELGAGGTALRMRLARYGAAAALASVPLATYLLLPRVYVYAWYRARRRWVVVGERTRR